MKRSAFIVLAGIICISIILILRPKLPVSNKETMITQTMVTNPAIAAESTNISLSVVTKHAMPKTVVPPEPTKLLDAGKAQSIAEWTNAIPSIKLLTHSPYNDSWIMEQREAGKCPTLLLTSTNGKAVQYTAELIDVEAVSDHIRAVELHTVNLNIDETRELGLQLCDLLGHDPKDFLAWCDKVGNNWVDKPLYDGFSLPVPNSNKFNGFGVHATFNSEKPWYILFFITDP